MPQAKRKRERERDNERSIASSAQLWCYYENDQGKEKKRRLCTVVPASTKGWDHRDLTCVVLVLPRRCICEGEIKASHIGMCDTGMDFVWGKGKIKFAPRASVQCHGVSLFCFGSSLAFKFQANPATSHSKLRGLLKETQSLIGDEHLKPYILCYFCYYFI